MPTYTVACKQCGKEHEPTPATLRAGLRHVCPDWGRSCPSLRRWDRDDWCTTAPHAAPVPADTFLK
jgi:hypothetical protein